MSKTLRNTLDPHAMVDQFGPDGARYLLLSSNSTGLFSYTKIVPRISISVLPP